MANRTFLNPVYKLTRARFCFRMFSVMTVDLAHRGWVRWDCPTLRPPRPPMLRPPWWRPSSQPPIVSLHVARLVVSPLRAASGLWQCVALHPYQCNPFINKYHSRGPGRGDWVSLSGSAANNTEEGPAPDTGPRDGLKEHGFHDQLDSPQSGDERRRLCSQQVTHRLAVLP